MVGRTWVLRGAVLPRGPLDLRKHSGKRNAFTPVSSFASQRGRIFKPELIISLPSPALAPLMRHAEQLRKEEGAKTMSLCGHAQLFSTYPAPFLGMCTLPVVGTLTPGLSGEFGCGYPTPASQSKVRKHQLQNSWL